MPGVRLVRGLAWFVLLLLDEATVTLGSGAGRSGASVAAGGVCSHVSDQPTIQFLP